MIVLQQSSQSLPACFKGTASPPGLVLATLLSLFVEGHAWTYLLWSEGLYR